MADHKKIIVLNASIFTTNLKVILIVVSRLASVVRIFPKIGRARIVVRRKAFLNWPIFSSRLVAKICHSGEY